MRLMAVRSEPLSELFDDLDDLVASISVCAGVVEELFRALN